MVAVTNLIWPGYGTRFLQVVASIYPGYDSSGSIGAVIVGTVYALIDGAIFGLVFGWLYNWFLSKRSPA
jgi:membrane associated rhomboid family serine protease